MGGPVWPLPGSPGGRPSVGGCGSTSCAVSSSRARFLKAAGRLGRGSKPTESHVNVNFGPVYFSLGATSTMAPPSLLAPPLGFWHFLSVDYAPRAWPWPVRIASKQNLASSI